MNNEMSFVVKKKKFRGLEAEDLKKLTTNEFANLICARERRNILRSTEAAESFIKKAEKKIAKNKVPKTHTREMVILPKFIDWTIGVHNGKEFVPVKITLEMVGHRLGEFAMTRRQVKHGTAGVGATKGTSSLSVK
jgi:small subunit ribosomal protein S19